MPGNKTEAFIVFQYANHRIHRGIVVRAEPFKVVFEKNRELIGEGDKYSRQQNQGQALFPSQCTENKIEEDQVQRDPAHLVGSQNPKLIPGFSAQVVE